MPIRSVSPYLILHGNVGRALELYGAAFGAQVKELQRLGDVDPRCPEARRAWIVHASLRLGESLLMLSDGPGEVTRATTSGLSIAIDFDEVSELYRSFDALAATGQAIVRPLPAPWRAAFAVVQDELGVCWMLNCA
jgi:PhnB protein